MGFPHLCICDIFIRFLECSLGLATQGFFLSVFSFHKDHLVVESRENHGFLQNLRVKELNCQDSPCSGTIISSFFSKILELLSKKNLNAYFTKFKKNEILTKIPALYRTWNYVRGLPASSPALLLLYQLHPFGDLSMCFNMPKNIPIVVLHRWISF